MTADQPAAAAREFPVAWVEALARAEVASVGDDWDDPALTPDTPRRRAEEFRESFREHARIMLAALDQAGALAPDVNDTSDHAKAADFWFTVAVNTAARAESAYQRGREAAHVAELVEAAWRAGYGQDRDDEAAGKDTGGDFPPGCICFIREDPDYGEVYTRPAGQACPVHDCTCDVPLRCRVHADPTA